ncbi:MAG TPA: WD40 repeat domain-containing protein, partial [Pilimelia sp.]|nr:WD40 repeat domain-containing protein [Pilimelia sp.]
AATCTPTADPLAGLAGAVAALCPAVGRDAAALAGRLRAAPGEVAAEVRAGLSGRDARALLVVDQCEEVFTECRDEADRLAFLSALAALSGGARPAALVVVGVRADFLGRCAAYPPLADALQRHLVVAGPMAADELRKAITGPAHEVGITLEDGLVDLLLAELRTGDPADPPAAGDAGRLPLLSHALLATWERHRDARLTVADYRATGGIRGALAATADRAMLSLDGPGRRTAELLLRRLVRIGDGVDDTRRRASLAALRAELPDPAATDAVITAFTARGTRLLTVSDDAVQITHEALLHAWPTLRRWITSGREGLLVEQHLADAAAAWEALGREDAALYAGSRLDRALEWFQDPDHRDRLGPLPRAFLAASQALLETQRADERRRARLRTALTAALGVLLAVSAVAATLALRATGRAQASERTMKIDALLTQAQAVRTSDPSLSLRLGLAAHAVRPDRGSRTALLRTLLDSRFAGELPARYPDEVRGVAASADGRTLLVGGREKPTQVWDTTDPHKPRPLAELPHPAGWVTGDTYAIALSPDGRTALDGNSVWDLTDRAHPRPLAYLPRRPDPPERPGAEPFPSSEYASWAVAYHAGRRLGLTAGGFPADDTRGRAVLWDLSRPAAPRRLGELSGHTGPVWAAAFSPDGRTVVTGSNATAATVWDVTAPRRPHRRADLPGHPGPVWTVAVSARGTVATGSDDGIAVLWSLAGAAPRRLGEVAGHSGPVWVTAFSADGRHLVTGARSDTNAVLWDVTDPRRPLRLGAVSQNEVVSGAVFAGRGPWFHTGGLQGGVRRWSVADPLRPGARPAPADPSSVDATGTLVVTSPLHPDVPAALWRLADGAPPRRLASLPDNPYPAALDDAGRLLATSSGRAARAAAFVDVRDPARPRPLATLPDLDVEALSPDGGYAVATDDSGGAVVVDLTSPASPQVVARLPDAGAVTVSADARTLVADGGDGPHTVWSLDDPRRPQRLYRVSGYQVAPAPGRRFFLDHPADKPYVVLLRPGPDGPVPVQQLDGRAPVLSRDGRLVLTQHDRRAVLWDLADVRHPYRVAVLDGVPPTALTPDARWLLAPGGLYDIGRIRDVLADPVAQACAVAQHGLSAPQWREYAADLPPQPTCVAAHAVG